MTEHAGSTTDSSLAHLRLAQAAPAAGPEDGCAQTTVGTPVTLPPVPDGARAEGTDTVLSFTAPEHGTVEPGPDGRLTYTPEPGFTGLDRFSYQTAPDGARAEAFVLVNPAAPGGEAVTGSLDPAALPRIAEACAEAASLTTASLAGPAVTVPPPQPGEQIVVATEPGQEITFADPAFADARYLPVEGGLLVLLPDGRTVFLQGFEAAAQSDAPVTLRVADGVEVNGADLLASLEPGGIVPAFGEVGPQAGASPDGGGSFREYADPGLGPLPDALGLLPPTAIGTIQGQVLTALATDGQGDNDDSDGDGGTQPPPPLENLPPSLLVDGSETLVVTEVSDDFDFQTSGAFPDLRERSSVSPELINGILASDVTLDVTRDATITFVSEVGKDRNTLGVFRIDANGNLVDPQVLFEDTRTGGENGPLQAGDSVTVTDLPAGSRLGFFLIRMGATLNADIDYDDGTLAFEPGTTDLVFTPNGGGPSVPVRGELFQSYDPALNPDGTEHFLSGIGPDGGLLVGVEDLPADFFKYDADFNDIVFKLDYSASVSIVTENASGDLGAVITDADSANMSAASAELTAGARPGDALVFDGYAIGAGGQLLDEANGGAPTGVFVTEDTGTSLRLEGGASSATYQQILSSLTLSNEAGELGSRTLTLSVEDEEGASSPPAEVTFDLVPSGGAGSFAASADGGRLPMADVLDDDPGIAQVAGGRGGDDAVPSGATGDGGAAAFVAPAPVMPELPQVDQAA